jgi:hypothetical protein
VSVSAPPTTSVPAPAPRPPAPAAAPAAPPPLPGGQPSASAARTAVPPPPPASAPAAAARAAAAPFTPTPPAPGKSNKKLLAIVGATVAAVVLIVAGVVIFSGGDDSKSADTTEETVETIDPDTTDTVDTTIPDTTTPVTETIDTTDVTFEAAADIPGDQLRAALVSIDEVNAQETGFTATNPGNSGDDLCGQTPTFQPVNRAASAFLRQFGSDPNDGQFLTNQLEVYFDNIEADIQFDDSLSVVQNATDCSQTVDGVEFGLQLNAVRAGSDLMATFPGCEEGANILIISTPADTTLAPHQTNIWAMRCGNVISTVSVDEPEASADDNVTAGLIGTMAGASFDKVSTLPLQHDVP